MLDEKHLKTSHILRWEDPLKKGIQNYNFKDFVHKFGTNRWIAPGETSKHNFFTVERYNGKMDIPDILLYVLTYALRIPQFWL